MPCAPRGISHGRNAMARCWEAGKQVTSTSHGHLDMARAGARCLAQRALIKDMLMDTRSQEAPYGGWVDLLGGLTSSLASKT